MTHGHELWGGECGRKGGGQDGVEWGGKWDNCNGIIKYILKKKDSFLFVAGGHCVGISPSYKVDMYFSSISLLSCCCCGTEDVEAPTEQNLSVQVSQAKNPKTALSSQESHPCESC